MTEKKNPGFHTAVKSGVLSLVPEICLVLQLNVSSLKDRIFSFFFLLGIISETADGWLAKYDDDRQVDKCKEAHDYVCRGPCNGELHEGAAKSTTVAKRRKTVSSFLPGFLSHR